MYIRFYALIGASVYFTKSAVPLWALVLQPEISSKYKDDKDTDVKPTKKA